MPLNFGEPVWLNAYWYTFLPSGWKWNQFRSHGQALVGRNSRHWEPDPPEGREEDFCGTYGNFSKIAGDPGYFKNGLRAIKCSDSNTKGFVAKNICVKEAANICDMPNSNQVTTPLTTDTDSDWARKKRNAKSSIYKLEPTAIDLAFDPLLKYTGKQLLMKRRNELKKNFQTMNFTKSYKLVLHFNKETVNILIFSPHSSSGTCLRFYGKLSCRALMSKQKILAPFKRDPC